MEDAAVCVKCHVVGQFVNETNTFPKHRFCVSVDMVLPFNPTRNMHIGFIDSEPMMKVKSIEWCHETQTLTLWGHCHLNAWSEEMFLETLNKHREVFGEQVTEFWDKF